jgi:hypothetical protein
MITDDDLIAALNKDAKGADAQQHILMLHHMGSTADEMAQQLYRKRVWEKDSGGAFKGLSIDERETARGKERKQATLDVESMLALAQEEHERRLEAAREAGDRPADQEPAGAHADGERSRYPVSKIG